MAIDIGEGLRGIQPVTEVLRADMRFHRDPSSAFNFREFSDSLEDCLKNREVIDGSKVLDDIKQKYTRLYNDTGVEPNAIMITSDYLSTALAQTDCLFEYKLVKGVSIRLFGMEVIPIQGTKSVRVCITEKVGE